MKLKGVNWFEANVEKVALGVGALALAGTFGLQMFTQPNMIKVGNESFTPARAVDPVNRAAEALNAQVNAADPKLPPPPDSNLLEKLIAGMTSPVAPPARVALGRSPNIGQGKGTGTVEVDYATLNVPAPAELAAVSFGSTIHPMEVQAHPDLARWLPKEQPFDKQAVTVGATFNALELKSALLTDPDGDGPIMPIPQAWWRNPLAAGSDEIEIIAVQVERETLSPAEDSKDAPGSVVMVEPMPGRENALKIWNAGVKTVGDMGSGLAQIRQLGEQVVRPPYYATIAGQPWAEPSVLAIQVKEGDEKAAQAKLVEKLKKDLEALNKQIEDVKQRVDAAPEPGLRRDREQPPPPPGRGRGPGPVAPPTTAPRDPNANVDKRQLQAQLKGLETRRTNLSRRLVSLGVKDAEVGANTAGAATPALTFLDNSEVKIWAHDITAVPGAIYRYRVRVVINNPFFGRQLKKSQEKLAEKSLLEGPWSEWSNPVDVDRNDYFFVTAASDGTGNTVNPRPHASVELFKFYYGFWRKASIGAEPGDKLEGSAKLPELETFDMSKLAAGGQPPPPGVAPPPPPAPGRLPGRDDRGPAANPGAEVPPELAGLTRSPLPRDLPIKVDAIFLDAYRLPFGSAGLGGGTRDVIEAILRGVGGNVISRIPEQERLQDRYKRLDASAKMGMNQGKPEVKPIDEKKQIGPGPIPRPQPSKGGPPGGGGG
jgi:hypothetical protein